MSRVYLRYCRGICRHFEGTRDVSYVWLPMVTEPSERVWMMRAPTLSVGEPEIGLWDRPEQTRLGKACEVEHGYLCRSPTHCFNSIINWCILDIEWCHRTNVVNDCDVPLCYLRSIGRLFEWNEQTDETCPGHWRLCHVRTFRIMSW